MLTLSTIALLFSSFAAVEAQQAVPTGLIGTWTSKSKTVFTGPGFYNPVDEVITEPRLPGTSFSFTSDGFYEEAIYQAIANPANPSCPQAIIQFQHGTFILPVNGSIVLTPFAVDGRQIWSDPCANDNSIYTRYNQTEVYRNYELLIDEYRSEHRLNMYKFDGAPMPPMYLAYNPPQMLPTVTMNPTAVAETGTPTATATSAKIKRSLHGEPQLQRRSLVEWLDGIDLDKLWWISVGSIVIGGVGYFCI